MNGFGFGHNQIADIGVKTFSLTCKFFFFSNNLLTLHIGSQVIDRCTLGYLFWGCFGTERQA